MINWHFNNADNEADFEPILTKMSKKRYIFEIFFQKSSEFEKIDEFLSQNEKILTYFWKKVQKKMLITGFSQIFKITPIYNGLSGKKSQK